MLDLLKDLNERQREAVTAPMGPVLVLAGAGSGKTRVLTYRLAYLLQQKLFKPQDLLALTFTNKAAGEMRERINKILERNSLPTPSLIKEGERGSSLTMGTFHSVCARILRAEIEKERGYTRNFVIYDSEDSLRVLKQILIELGLSEQFRPQVFAYYISQAKNRLIAPADLSLDNSFFQETLQKVYEWYQEELQHSNALDFDDLLGLVCELFSQNPKILKKYQDRFQYVLVDEYQDTNHAQYVMLKLLVQEHRNIFVVGDDAQSIYGFRGANMQNILDFKKDYPEARIISLEQNYRSTQNILDAAAKVIKLNPFQYEKNLWTQSATGSKINLYEARDEEDEAEFVLKRILNMEYGISNQIPDDLNDTVILYRTHAQSRPFEEVLVGSGIPYQIVGGIKFYERKEIKDTLAYLRLVLNPRDLVSLSRVINVPVRGIGRVAFQTLQQGLSKYDYSFERLLNNLDGLELSDKARAGAKEFFNLYSFDLSPNLSPSPGERSSFNLLDVMEFILKRSGYKEVLLQDGEEGQTRWENIEELWNVAAKYKRLPWREGAVAFLEEAALMTDLDSMEEGGNKLTLMTLHSAKGLEYAHVFLVGVEEGLLPHSRSLLNPQEVAEEIRLAYVGITRAKQNLYLSYARQRQSYGELKRCVPSRILKAIPKRLLNKL